MKQLLILCLSGILAVHALTVTIKNGVEQCIWEVGKIGDQLYASYEVTKGDEKNLIIKAWLVLCVDVADYRQKWWNSVFFRREGER